MQMEDLIGFFQGSLVDDFGYSDDQVVDSLQLVMEELRRAKMDLPPKGDDSIEKPTKPFGILTPPSVEQFYNSITVETTDQSGTTGDDRRKSMLLIRPSIPPDGGPVKVPSPIFLRMSRISSGQYSPSVEGEENDAESSKAASFIEYQSSRTSFVDSTSDIGASLSGAGSAQGDLTLSRNPFPINLNLDDVEVVANGGETWPFRRASNSPSEYDNLGDMSTRYEQDLENTLDSIEFDASGMNWPDFSNTSSSSSRALRSFGANAKAGALFAARTQQMHRDSIRKSSSHNKNSSPTSNSIGGSQGASWNSDHENNGNVASPSFSQFNPMSKSLDLTLASAPVVGDDVFTHFLDDIKPSRVLPSSDGAKEWRSTNSTNPSHNEHAIIIPIQHLSERCGSDNGSSSQRTRQTNGLNSLSSSFKSSITMPPLKVNTILTPIPVLHMRTVPVHHLQSTVISPQRLASSGDEERVPHRISLSKSSNGLPSLSMTSRSVDDKSKTSRSVDGESVDLVNDIAGDSVATVKSTARSNSVTTAMSTAVDSGAIAKSAIRKTNSPRVKPKPPAVRPRPVVVRPTNNLDTTVVAEMRLPVVPMDGV